MKPGIGLHPRTKSDDELAAEGWTHRFVGSPPRLQEMIELYESLGYDVWLETQHPDDLQSECQDCVLALTFFRVIYTRPREMRG
jgi:hypothetical protein